MLRVQLAGGRRAATARRVTAWLGVAVLLCSAQAPAADDAPPLPAVRFNGFATVGSLATQISQPWIFRRDLTQPNTSGGYANALVDSRIGLQANYSPAPAWELVGQLVAKRRRSDAPVSEMVQWAFVSYQPEPDFKIRLGRTSPDFFLLSDYRDVGFAFPWVRPSIEFYGWEPLTSIDGIDLTKSWNTRMAVWRLKAAYGFSEATLSAEPSDDQLKLRGHNLMTLAASGESGGFTAKLSYAFVRVDVSRFAAAKQAIQALSPIEALAAQLPAQVVAEERSLAYNEAPSGALSRYFGVGLAYDRGPWVTQAELSYVSGDVLQERAWRGYGSFGYRIGPFLPYVAAARVLPRSATVNPPSDWAAALAQVLPGPPVQAQAQALALQSLGDTIATDINASFYNQRSVSLGARWDLSAQTALKLQWDYYHVYANGAGLWGGGNNNSAYANVFSAVVDLVF